VTQEAKGNIASVGGALVKLEVSTCIRKHTQEKTLLLATSVERVLVE